jgi:hypothetical protein
MFQRATLCGTPPTSCGLAYRYSGVSPPVGVCVQKFFLDDFFRRGCRPRVGTFDYAVKGEAGSAGLCMAKT